MHSKFVPLLASAGLLAFPLQDSSADYLHSRRGSSVSANRSEPSLGINTALMSSSSGTTFPLDETGQSSIRPARRFRADRQGSMAVAYGQSFSFSPSRISTNEPMLDAKNFVHKGIVATRDFSEPNTRAGLTGPASQSNGSFDRTFSLEQTNFARDVVDWNSPASTSVPAGRTFTIELDLNAEARPKDQEKSSDPILEVPKDKNKEKYAGPVASVPDSGSTALLLGTSLLALGVAARRFASRRDSSSRTKPRPWFAAAGF
jgi:VPDSG-CTERM motif